MLCSRYFISIIATMCVSRSVFTGGRMQQEKCICKKVKGKSVGDDASSARVGDKDNDKIRNKQKVVVASISSSSSNDVTKEETKVYSCSSCPRKFTCQALDGHRKAHRTEWESLLNMSDDDDDGKIQLQKLPFPNSTSGLKRISFGDSSSTLINASSTIDKLLLSAHRYPLANPTNTLKQPSPMYSLHNPTNTLKGPSPRHPLSNPTNTIKDPSSGHTLVRPTDTMKGPSPRHSVSISTYIVNGPSPKYTLVNLANTLKKQSPRYPLANTTNTIKGPLESAPWNIYANPRNTLIGPSLGTPCLSFFSPTNTLLMPSIPYLNHPYNSAKPHYKSALGVRHESMIHKPCQCRQLGGSTSFGKQQVMEGNIRRFGTNNNHVDLRSLLTAAGSTSSSMPEGRVESKAPNSFSSSSSFQSRGGKGIEVPELFPLTPPQERRNHDIDHTLQVLALKPDKNGEDDDLDLKL